MAGTIATSRYPPGSGRTTRAPPVPLLRGLRGGAPLPGIAPARFMRVRIVRSALGRGSGDGGVPRSFLRARRPAPTSLELVARLVSSSVAFDDLLGLLFGARLRLALSRLRDGGPTLRGTCGGDPRTPCDFAGVRLG